MEEQNETGGTANAVPAPENNGPFLSDDGFSSQPANTPAIADLDKQIAEAMKDPNYLSGTNPKTHRELVEKVQSFYRLRADITQPVVDEQNQRDIAAANAQIAFQKEAAAEFKALTALGFKGRMPSNITEVHVDAWKGQRLCAQGNFAELAPHVSKDLPPKTANTFTQFVNDADIDSDLKTQIAELVIAHNFEMKRSRK